MNYNAKTSSISSRGEKLTRSATAVLTSARDSAFSKDCAIIYINGLKLIHDTICPEYSAAYIFWHSSSLNSASCP